MQNNCDSLIFRDTYAFYENSYHSCINMRILAYYNRANISKLTPLLEYPYKREATLSTSHQLLIIVHINKTKLFLKSLVYKYRSFHLKFIKLRKYPVFYFWFSNNFKIECKFVLNRLIIVNIDDPKLLPNFHVH